MCHDPFTKTFPPQKVTRAFSPLLESSSIRSWAAGEVTLRAVPWGQLLLLPHRKPFTPQLINKLTNYSINLAGKHPFPFTGCLEGQGQDKTASNLKRFDAETRGQQPQRVGWIPCQQCPLPGAGDGLSCRDAGLGCRDAGLICRDAGAELCPGTYHEQDKNAEISAAQLPTFHVGVGAPRLLLPDVQGLSQQRTAVLPEGSF